jgi:hypothetical protein
MLTTAPSQALEVHCYAAEATALKWKHLQFWNLLDKYVEKTEKGYLG